MIEKALTVSEELVAEHPNIPDDAASQVFIRVRLAEVLERMGETSAAKEARGRVERLRPEHDRRDGNRPGPSGPPPRAFPAKSR